MKLTKEDLDKIRINRKKAARDVRHWARQIRKVERRARADPEYYPKAEIKRYRRFLRADKERLKFYRAFQSK